jgi:hypothetical protein
VYTAFSEILDRSQRITCVWKVKNLVPAQGCSLKHEKNACVIWYHLKPQTPRIKLRSHTYPEHLNDLYSLPNTVRVVKSKKMRSARHIARMGEEGSVYRVLVGKPEEKRPLGRPRRWWEDNIKMDLQEVWGGCGDWMELAQDSDRWRALVSTVKNYQGP